MDRIAHMDLMRDQIFYQEIDEVDILATEENFDDQTFEHHHLSLH